MKLHLILTAMIAGAAFAGTAYAESIDADELHKYCSSEDGTNGSGFCLGYVAGVIDTTSDLGAKCLPKDVTLSQVWDVFKQYLQNHPEKRHLEASTLVSEAIEEAFCKS